MAMEALRIFLNSLETEEQERYAERCDTSVGYLRKVLSTKGRIGESLTISLEKHSGGAVPVENTRPDVDWEYLRLRRSSISPVCETTPNSG